MSKEIVTLPNKEEMMKRLVSVDDNSHLKERFYPLLTKRAGEEKVAEGVALMFVLAINDYTQGMPPIVFGIMLMTAPKFIDAIIDNNDVAKKAKEILKEST